MSAPMAAAGLGALDGWLIGGQADLYGSSLRDYAPACWHVVEPVTPYIPGYHIDAMGEALQAVSDGDLRFVILSVAPRSMKSLQTCVFWPTWDWIKHPWRRWIFGAYGMNLSEGHSVDARRVIDSPWYQARWGCRCLATPHASWCGAYRLTTDQNVKTRYENDRTGQRLTASVDAGTTGEGGDILVMDDPIDILKAMSEATRKKAVDYVKKVWFGRMNDPKKSAMVFIAQRTHLEDVTGTLLKEMQYPWVEFRIPTEYNPKKHCVVKWTRTETVVDERDAAGKPTKTHEVKTPAMWEDWRKGEPRGTLMWPERFGEVENRRAKLDSIAYPAQHDQDPQPEGGGMFKHAWIRFWKPAMLNLPPVVDTEGRMYLCVDLPQRFDLVATRESLHDLIGPNRLVMRGPWDQLAQSWDCTFKGVADQVRKGKLPDNVSAGVVGRIGGEVFLLDRTFARMDFPTTLDAMADMTERWPGAIAKLVEDKANGPAVIATMRKRVGGLIPVTPEGSKVQRVLRKGATQGEKDARAMSMLEIVHSGAFYLPHPLIAPWVWDVVTCLTTFPNGEQDDDVDMLSQVLMYLQPWIWREAEQAHNEAKAKGKPMNSVQDLHRERINRATQQALKPPPSANAPVNPYGGRR